MKVLTVVVLLVVVLAGCGSGAPQSASDVAPTPTGELGEAIACIRMTEDHSFHALIAAGHRVEYERQVWSVDGITIGYAPYEDEAFDACGPVDLIRTIERF